MNPFQNSKDYCSNDSEALLIICKIVTVFTDGLTYSRSRDDSLSMPVDMPLVHVGRKVFTLNKKLMPKLIIQRDRVMNVVIR